MPQGCGRSCWPTSSLRPLRCARPPTPCANALPSSHAHGARYSQACTVADATDKEGFGEEASEEEIFDLLEALGLEGFVEDLLDYAYDVGVLSLIHI